MTNPEFPKCEECISYAICVHLLRIKCDIISQFGDDTNDIYTHSRFWKEINKTLPNAGIIVKER